MKETGELSRSESGVRTTRIDITDRTFQLAVRVVSMVNALPKSVAGQAIARQVIRSGTSVGANIEEAQGSQSKKDFVRRMTIARAEAQETLYWLRLIAECGMIGKARLAPLIQETVEIVRILVTIVRKAKG